MNKWTVHQVKEKKIAIAGRWLLVEVWLYFNMKTHILHLKYIFHIKKVRTSIWKLSCMQDKTGSLLNEMSLIMVAEIDMKEPGGTVDLW